MCKFVLGLITFVTCVFTNSLLMAESCCSLTVSNWKIDANVGYFYPTSKQLRKVISGGADYQFMLSYKWSNCFGIVCGVDYFSQEGRSKTKLMLVPLTLGLKVTSIFSTFCNGSQVLQGYLLIGPRWYFGKVSYHTDDISRHDHAQCFGGVAGVGLEYLAGCFSLNTFLNYSQAKLHVHSHENIDNFNGNVGGFVIGAGVGFNF